MNEPPKPKEPNYITLEGAQRIQSEIIDLRSKQRPKIVQEVSDAAAQGDRSENAEYIYGKKKLREIDRRLHFLIKRLEIATVVEPRVDPKGRVLFGAVVDVEDEDGKSATYRIVGADEIDTNAGDISWRSPLGRALLGKKAGDSFPFRRPSGETEMTVLDVRYPAAE